MTDVIYWIGAAVIGWLGLGMATAMLALCMELVLVLWTWCRAAIMAPAKTPRNLGDIVPG